MNPNILRAMIIAQMRAILGFVFRYIMAQVQDNGDGTYSITAHMVELLRHCSDKNAPLPGKMTDLDTIMADDTIAILRRFDPAELANQLLRLNMGG